MDGPSRLDDPWFYDSTTWVKKHGQKIEVLTSDVDEYLRKGFIVVGPGQPYGPTSFIDKKKVAAFNAVKRFFVLDPGEPPEPEE